ncbi:hypothetical protein AM1_D0122 (plasmid) [Acaryochloris marina MBIC11017]|uniref:Uncharacterized protein n=1 Tax=Acaryochloris marina (strain MBIC 11017) TaxID=329726 RepID=A8ZNN1_ACAM1|nr:hypothetical protein AM1_D0122 [Acaryochloris marina MBIC11017]
MKSVFVTLVRPESWPLLKNLNVEVKSKLRVILNRDIIAFLQSHVQVQTEH